MVLVQWKEERQVRPFHLWRREDDDQYPFQFLRVLVGQGKRGKGGRWWKGKIILPSLLLHPPTRANPKFKGGGEEKGSVSPSTPSQFYEECAREELINPSSTPTALFLENGNSWKSLSSLSLSPFPTPSSSLS